MPRISDSKESKLRRVIRDAIAIDPLISMSALQRAVESKIARPIDEVFLKKLVKRVTGEMVIVADREKVEERVSQLREKNRIVVDELLRMAFPSATSLEHTSVTDRRKALEAICRIENAQVKLEMDLGLFTRHLGKLDIDHRTVPLDDDTRNAIKAAFMMWGVATPVGRKIEAVATVSPQPKEIPHGPTNTQQPTKPVATRIPTAGSTGLAVS